MVPLFLQNQKDTVNKSLEETAKEIADLQVTVSDSICIIIVHTFS